MKHVYEGELRAWYSEDGSTSHSDGLTLVVDDRFYFPVNEHFLKREDFRMTDEEVEHLDDESEPVSYRVMRWRNMRITVEQLEKPS